MARPRFDQLRVAGGTCFHVDHDRLVIRPTRLDSPRSSHMLTKGSPVALGFRMCVSAPSLSLYLE